MLCCVLWYSPVAVKRMLKAFHEAAAREMRLLIESDGHPNVVRLTIHAH